jgi:uncharacterized protein (TIGR03067 family)
MIGRHSRELLMTHALLVLAVTVAAPAAKDGKKDLPGLVGEWAAESAVVRGKPDNPPPGTTWTFTADGKSVLRVGDGNGEVAGTYKADPKKDPAEVDITAGPKGGPVKGLYKVEGDTLTLCLVTDGEERPKKIESPADSKAIVITFKRVKKKD